MHSSRMYTAWFTALSCMLGYTSPACSIAYWDTHNHPLWTDTHEYTHYLSATPFAGVNNEHLDIFFETDGVKVDIALFCIIEKVSSCYITDLNIRSANRISCPHNVDIVITTNLNEFGLCLCGDFVWSHKRKKNIMFITDRKGKVKFHRRVWFCLESALWLLDHCSAFLSCNRYASCWDASW